MRSLTFMLRLQRHRKRGRGGVTEVERERERVSDREWEREKYSVWALLGQLIFMPQTHLVRPFSCFSLSRFLSLCRFVPQLAAASNRLTWCPQLIDCQVFNQLPSHTLLSTSLPSLSILCLSSADKWLPGCPEKYAKVLRKTFYA